MRANLSFGDQLELPVRAQLELDLGGQETERACTDYTCAVRTIPSWVGIQVSMKKKKTLFIMRYRCLTKI